MKQYQLPREFAEKWIAALRSGEYKQGRNQMGDAEVGYCCIAVGGKVCGLSDEDLPPLVFSHMVEQVDDKYTKIPVQLKGDANRNGLVRMLTSFNDVEYWKFPAIADWIEANVDFV